MGNKELQQSTGCIDCVLQDMRDEVVLSMWKRMGNNLIGCDAEDLLLAGYYLEDNRFSMDA